MRVDLSNIRLFAGMTQEDTAALLPCLGARERTYKKGELIMTEGAPAEHIGVVLSGMVMIEMSDVWGNNSVLSSIDPGGTFAEVYACVPDEPLLVNVVAAEDSSVLLLNASRALSPCSRACAYHAVLIRNLLALCAAKNLQLSRRILHCAPKTIRKRLLSYFSECIKRSGSYSFDIPYNRQQLADYLGVDRSALSNELSLMQRDGLISYSKNRFTVSETAETH